MFYLLDRVGNAGASCCFGGIFGSGRWLLCAQAAFLATTPFCFCLGTRVLAPPLTLRLDAPLCYP